MGPHCVAVRFLHPRLASQGVATDGRLSGKNPTSRVQIHHSLRDLGRETLLMHITHPGTAAPRFLRVSLIRQLEVRGLPKRTPKARRRTEAAGVARLACAPPCPTGTPTGVLPIYIGIAEGERSEPWGKRALITLALAGRRKRRIHDRGLPPLHPSRDTLHAVTERHFAAATCPGGTSETSSAPSVLGSTFAAPWPPATFHGARPEAPSDLHDSNPRAAETTTRNEVGHGCSDR